MAAPRASAQWVRVDSTGLPQGFFVASSLHATPEAVYAVVGQSPMALYRSTDEGATWQRIPEADRLAVVAAVRASGASVVAHARDWGFHVSVDDGATWSAAPFVTPNKDVLLQAARVDGPGGRSHVVRMGDLRLYVTHDDFANVAAALPDVQVDALVVNRGVILAMSGTTQTGVLYRSTDGGRTWAQQPGTGLASQALYTSLDTFFVSGVEPTPTTPRALAASVDGLSWTIVARGADLPAPVAWASDASHSAFVQSGLNAAFKTSISVSVRSGRAMQDITGNFPRERFGTLDIGPCLPTTQNVALTRRHVFALSRCTANGTSVSNALYRHALPAGVTVDAEATASVPGDLSFDAPAPNPARSTVRFAYRTGTTEARLTVVDLLGRTVAVVADGLHAAGPHVAAFDAARLVPGLYVVRLETSQGGLSRPLAVMR